MSKAQKIVILDRIGNAYEPYDRKFMLQMTYEFCCRNSCIIRNVSVVLLRRQIRVRTPQVLALHVCFEIDSLSDAKWKFLRNSIGSWAVGLKILPGDADTTILFPSDFN